MLGFVIINTRRMPTKNAYLTSYMMQRAYRMNKVEEARLQHELFNQNREKVGNTLFLLRDPESLQDEQSRGSQGTAWGLQPKKGEGR